MFKLLLFLAALGLVRAQLTPDCEVLENGCPVDFTINLLLPHETHCRYYYQCVAGETVLRRCGVNTVFNEAAQTCDHPANVDRTCEEGELPGRPPVDSPESVEIDFLENGCPSDHRITWHLPHDYYCNAYYQCVFGDKVIRYCPPGLHFNNATQTCDFPGNVNCVGGIYTPTERPPGVPDTPPSIDFDINGCPTDHSVNWLVPHEDCTKFYFCVWGSLVESDCPAGLHFNPVQQRCDNPATAGCMNFPCKEDPDAPCSSETEDPPVDCGNGPGNPCESEEDPPPGGDDPPPGDDCGNGPGNPCESEEVPPPGEDCGNGPGIPCSNEEVPPPGEDCGNGPGNPCSSEEDPPPGGDDPGCDEDNRCEEECHVLPWAHEDCDKYWICYGNKPILGVCSNGLYFNPSTNTCDFACNVDCDSSRVRLTPNHEGLKLYIPWKKFDNNARELLKAIGQ